MAYTQKLFRSFPSAGKTGVETVSSRTCPHLTSYQKTEGSAMLTYEHVAPVHCVQVHPQQSPMPMFQEPASVVIIDRLALEGMSAYAGWKLPDSTSSSYGLHPMACHSPGSNFDISQGLKKQSSTSTDRFGEFSNIEEVRDGEENDEYDSVDPHALEPHFVTSPPLSPPSALPLSSASKKQYKHTFHYPPIRHTVDSGPPVGVCPSLEQPTNSDPQTSYLEVARAKLSLSLDGNLIAVGGQPELKIDPSLDVSRNLYRKAKSWVQSSHHHHFRRDERQRMNLRFDLIPEE